MYAPLHRHENLNDATHESLGELFGIANLRSLQHLAAMIRAKKIVGAMGADVYMPADEMAFTRVAANFRFPIMFLHGSKNECFLPRSTEQTMAVLQRANEEAVYERVSVSGYGHLDCIYGKDASRDVYPHVLRHLEKNA